MHRIAQLRDQPARFAPLLGVLYAEDFDDVPEEAAAEPPLDQQPAPEPPPISQEDLDRACQAAVAEAREHWQQKADQRRNELLETIAAAIADARDSAEERAEITAEATVQAILAMLSGALPHFCATHGHDEATALLEHLLPTLRAEPRIVIRVHPDLAPDLRRQFEERQHDFAGTLTVLPTAREPGDLTVEWENGSLVRDTKQILQAMQDALGQLGLDQPRETTPKRRLAHAE